jgi:tetratricopeptide (TPR) repeat protein
MRTKCLLVLGFPVLLMVFSCVSLPPNLAPPGPEEAPLVELPEPQEPEEIPLVEAPEPEEAPLVEASELPEPSEPEEAPLVEALEPSEPEAPPLVVEAPKPPEPEEAPLVEAPEPSEPEEVPLVEAPEPSEPEEVPLVEAPEPPEPEEVPLVVEAPEPPEPEEIPLVVEAPEPPEPEEAPLAELPEPPEPEELSLVEVPEPPEPEETPLVEAPEPPEPEAVPLVVEAPEPPEPEEIPLVEAPEPPEPQETTDDILGRVYALLEEGDYPGALALFDLIEAEEASSSRIRLLKASILCSTGDFPAARGIVNEIQKTEPNNVQALLILATLEGALGREREQKALLERIIRLDPQNIGAFIDLGNIAIRGQNRSPATAASYFDRALALDPENLEALLGRAGTYRYARNPKDAEELLNRGLTLYPEEASLWSERARIYREAGFLIQALEDLNTAKELDGNNYWISIDLGTLLLDMNRKEPALEEFIRAQSLNPDHFLSYAYTAGMKDEAGDYAGAEADYEALIRLRPDYYFAQEGLGTLKMRNHQWEEARNAFIQAYNHAPDEWSYALLGMMNWRRLGQPGNIRDFANLVMRNLSRDSLEYAMMRLYLDMNGDDGVVRRINQERNLTLKARMLYYLANYYDIKGNNRLADAIFSEIMNMEQRMTIPEWRLLSWALEERNLAIF